MRRIVFLFPVMLMNSCGGETVVDPSQPPAVVSVTLTPASFTLSSIGETRAMSARALTSGGQNIPGKTFTWQSSDPAVATVDSLGLVTATGNGLVDIVARTDGIAGTSNGTIQQLVASIDVSTMRLSFDGLLDTVPVNATPLDARQNPVDDVALRWQSSDSAVVNVDSVGQVVSLAKGAATILVTSGTVDASVDVTVDTDEVLLNSHAGTANGADGLVVLTLPDGAVGGQTVITIAAARTVPATTRLVDGTSFDFGPDGLVFNEQVLLAITYDPGTLPVGSDENDLVLHKVDGNSWSEVPESDVDTDANVVTAPIDGFSTYGILNNAAAIVVVSPTPDTISIGQSVQLDAEVHDSDGNVLTDRPITWSVSNTNVASVDTTGLVIGLSEGTVTVEANSDGIRGIAEITVRAVVADIILSPSDTSALRGNVVQFSATVRDSAGNELTREIEWAVSDSTLATINTSGLVSLLDTGTVVIAVTADQVTAQATLQILEPAATVEVMPSALELRTGDTATVVATPRAADGTILVGRPVRWVSSRPNIASVDSGGVVTGIDDGSAVITGFVAGAFGTASVTVIQRVTFITISPSADTVLTGRSEFFGVTTRAADSTILTGRTITWSSADSLIAAVTGSRVDGKRPGSTHIIAESEGVADSATITVLAPATVTVTPLSSSVMVGGAVQMAASSVDSIGGMLDYPVTWSSSNGAIATVDSTGFVSTFSQGGASITATTVGGEGIGQVWVRNSPVPDAATLAGRWIGRTNLDEEVYFSMDGLGLIDYFRLEIQMNFGFCGTRDIGMRPRNGTFQIVEGAFVDTLTWEPEWASPVGGFFVNSDSADGFYARGGGRFEVSLFPFICRGTRTFSAGSWYAVKQLPIASLEIALADTTFDLNALSIGRSVFLNWIALDVNGDTIIIQNETPVWTVDDVSVATLSSSGYLQPVAPGTTTVSVTHEGLMASMPIRVLDVDTVTIVGLVNPTVVMPRDTTIDTASSFFINVELRDSTGSTISTSGRTIVWSSSDSLVANRTTGGNLTGFAPGVANIVATYQSVNGPRADTLTVTVVNAASAGSGGVGPSLAPVNDLNLGSADGNDMTRRVATTHARNTARQSRQRRLVHPTGRSAAGFAGTDLGEGNALAVHTSQRNATRMDSNNLRSASTIEKPNGIMQRRDSG